MLYAQLNNEGLCIGISQLASEVSDSKLIPIDSLDDNLLWRKYENGAWSAEQFIPDTVVEPGAPDRVAQLEQVVDTLLTGGEAL